jgi:hypothetical protein
VARTCAAGSRPERGAVIRINLVRDRDTAYVATNFGEQRHKRVDGILRRRGSTRRVDAGRREVRTLHNKVRDGAIGAVVEGNEVR